jgi:uncharacterized protein YfdQ (DUF2303 family)
MNRKYPKTHDENFRKGTKMARKIADRESLDFIIDTLEDMIVNYREKFHEKRGDGTYWSKKKYRVARRQAFTALSNVCRSYINLGLDDEECKADWDTILTLQSRRGEAKWLDTENHQEGEKSQKAA